jgi:hypothetical protein
VIFAEIVVLRRFLHYVVRRRRRLLGLLQHLPVFLQSLLQGLSCFVNKLGISIMQRGNFGVAPRVCVLRKLAQAFVLSGGLRKLFHEGEFVDESYWKRCRDICPGIIFVSGV